MSAAPRVLFLLPPERAHRLAHTFLGVLGATVDPQRARPPEALRARLRTECLGLTFDHPLGLAAGFDKGEVHAAGLFALGFSHVEIGTITPRPQPGNPPPRLFRLVEHQALLNRMGFNNEGAAACAERLKKLDRARLPGPLGVNVGKNKDTPNERAVDDYLACLDALAPHADYVVINISSPNTPGLRALQDKASLEQLVKSCAARLKALPGNRRPLLVKLAPDLADEAFDEAVETAIGAGGDGLIATNTTLARPDALASHPHAKEAGGLSGAPLTARSTALVARAYRVAKGRVPIVGVGGIMNAEDAYAKIRAGATLVQAYTGFVYGGPGFARRVVRGLAALLARDGFQNVREAVGVDAR